MSLGGKYVFATVMCLVLPICILISCSSVLCLGYVCENCVVLDQCYEPLSLFVFSVCAYGGVFLVF